MGRVNLQIELPDDQIAGIRSVEVKINKVKGSAVVKKTVKKEDVKKEIDNGFNGDF